MSFSSNKIFSKRFNIFIITALLAFFSFFSIVVNKISSTPPFFSASDGQALGEGQAGERICLNGVLFNVLNGKIVSKVMEKEEDPIYAQDGSRIITNRAQAKCS